jgi:hypothetical protein
MYCQMMFCVLLQLLYVLVVRTGVLFPTVVIGRDNSVGIAICYGLDGPVIETRWGRKFSHRSKPALWPTQAPVQRVLPLSWGLRGLEVVLITTQSTGEVKKE